MSWQNFDELDDRALIMHYVLEKRQSGHFLPYQDYAIIGNWLSIAQDVDDLLLALEQLLPPYFKRFSNHQHAPSLKGIDRSVCSYLKQAKLRQHYE